jgi:hypothetical protein
MRHEIEGLPIVCLHCFARNRGVRYRDGNPPVILDPYITTTPTRSRLDVTRLISEGLVLDDHFVDCPDPECGSGLVHPTLVEVNAGGSITTIDHDGTRMHAGEPAGRGVLIRLGFTCEWGHEFSVVLHFHKGTTFLHVYGGDTEDETVPPNTIWRD